MIKVFPDARQKKISPTTNREKCIGNPLVTGEGTTTRMGSLKNSIHYNSRDGLISCLAFHRRLKNHLICLITEILWADYIISIRNERFMVCKLHSTLFQLD